MASVPKSMSLLSNPVTQLLAVGGSELTGSRRYLDFEGVETLRIQFKGQMSVRVEYSLDFGITWAVLIAEETYSGPDPYLGRWQQKPDELANWGDVLLRCIGIGAGLLVGVDYVELQYR